MKVDIISLSQMRRTVRDEVEARVSNINIELNGLREEILMLKEDLRTVTKDIRKVKQ